MQYIRFLNFSLVFLSLIAFSACSVRQDFAYEPEKIKSLPNKTPLRIAVMPFVDVRQEIDSGSTAWAWLPLVPTAANTVDAPQSQLDREKGNYYFPDLVAYGLALDLLKNNVGETVHLNPEMIDDYDLIIDGSMESLAKTNRKISYGLGPAGFLFHMFGFPPGSKGVDYKATYRIKDRNGNVVFEKPYEASWSRVDYEGDEYGVPIMEGINQTIRENNSEFLEEASSVFSKAAENEVELLRKRRFYSLLDPELKQLDTLRINLIQSGQAQSARFARITNEMAKRERWLEKFRQAERKIIDKQQTYLFRVQEARLEQIANIRQQKRSIEIQQQQMEAARDSAEKRAIAGAFVAGVIPAIQSANALQGGQWRSENTLMALQDTSAALAALPPPTPPPPDLTPYLNQLDVSFEGLESVGENPFRNLRGASLSEIRDKFLRQYKRLITPLSRL